MAIAIRKLMTLARVFEIVTPVMSGPLPLSPAASSKVIGLCPVGAEEALAAVTSASRTTKATFDILVFESAPLDSAIQAVRQPFTDEPAPTSDAGAKDTRSQRMGLFVESTGGADGFYGVVDVVEPART